MEMSFWSTIYFIGAAQGFVLAVALWRKTGNSLSNRVLSTWLILMSIDLTLRGLFINQQISWLLPPYVLSAFFPFLYGSLFYLYAKTLTQNHRLSLRDGVHFLGFIIMAGININWIINPWENQSRLFVIYEPSLYLYSVSYVIAGLMVIFQYQKSLDQQFTSIEGIDLIWLRVMAYSQIIIWLVAITQWLFPMRYYNHFVIYLVISIWMIVLGYLGLTQEAVKPLKKISKMKISADDGKFYEVEEKLKQLIEIEGIHLTPSLNIGQLAKRSGYPEYLISQLINHKFNSTFRDYINQLRIQEAQEILKSPANDKTILDVAYECGFVSKSTFNTAFKRITGQTPSSFRQRHVDAGEVAS